MRGLARGLAPGLLSARDVLGDTHSGCHAILRDDEGLQPHEAVEAMPQGHRTQSLRLAGLADLTPRRNQVHSRPDRES
jgi:hypothetical protein